MKMNEFLKAIKETKTKNEFEIKEDKYFTPEEVKNIIEGLSVPVFNEGKYYTEEEVKNLFEKLKSVNFHENVPKITKDEIIKNRQELLKEGVYVLVEEEVDLIESELLSKLKNDIDETEEEKDTEKRNLVETLVDTMYEKEEEVVEENKEGKSLIENLI